MIGIGFDFRALETLATIAVDDQRRLPLLHPGAEFSELSSHRRETIAFLNPQMGDVFDDRRAMGKSGHHR